VGRQAPAEGSGPSTTRSAGATTPGILLEVWATAFIVNQLVVRELDRVGIDPEGLAVLAMIRERGPITPTSLAAEVGYRLTTISDIVQRLEQAGRVKRKPNPLDGRSYLVSTTARGDQLLDKAGPAFERALEAIEGELDRPLADVDEAVDALKEATKRALRG
jgi:DNA-binding MarR family transcriptional regulator